jgi:hypothetical protein
VTARLQTLPRVGLATLALVAITGCAPRATVATAGRVIRIGLLEYRISPHAVTTKQGTHTFVVHNYGILAHNLVITHGTHDIAVSAPVYPGATTDLTVNLPPGRYTLKSDINSQVVAMNGPLFVVPR